MLYTFCTFIKELLIFVKSCDDLLYIDDAAIRIKPSLRSMAATAELQLAFVEFTYAPTCLPSTTGIFLRLSLMGFQR